MDPFLPVQIYFWIGVVHLVVVIIGSIYGDGLDYTNEVPPVDFFLILLGWPILWWKAFHR